MYLLHSTTQVERNAVMFRNIDSSPNTLNKLVSCSTPTVQGINHADNSKKRNKLQKKMPANMKFNQNAEDVEHTKAPFLNTMEANLLKKGKHILQDGKSTSKEVFAFKKNKRSRCNRPSFLAIISQAHESHNSSASSSTSDSTSQSDPRTPTPKAREDFVMAHKPTPLDLSGAAEVDFDETTIPSPNLTVSSDDMTSGESSHGSEDGDSDTDDSSAASVEFISAAEYTTPSENHDTPSAESTKTTSDAQPPKTSITPSDVMDWVVENTASLENRDASSADFTETIIDPQPSSTCCDDLDELVVALGTYTPVDNPDLSNISIRVSSEDVEDTNNDSDPALLSSTLSKTVISFGGHLTPPTTPLLPTASDTSSASDENITSNKSNDSVATGLGIGLELGPEPSACTEITTTSGQDYVPAKFSNASSIEEFEHEPLDTYQFKVSQLCEDIGFGTVSKIEHMEGGGYNRVIGLEFPGGRSYVLRIPRSEYKMPRDIQEQVAILSHVPRHLSPKGIVVPTVVAFDSTKDNALGAEYVLQERLQGVSAGEVYYDAPFVEKLQIAKTVAETLTKIGATQMPQPGRLTVRKGFPEVLHTAFAEPVDVDIVGFRRFPRSDLQPVTKQPLAALLHTLLEIRKQKNLSFTPYVELCNRLQEIVKEMEGAGFMKIWDDECVLWHWDLSAQNILLHPEQKSTENTKTTGNCCQHNTKKWVVSGVIDWDDATSVPLVCARRPPTWLWFRDSSRGEDWYDRDEELPRELTYEELLIKAVFDQEMTRLSPTYMEDAYQRGPWIRRLARFAFKPFVDEVPRANAQEFVEKWDNYYKTLAKDVEIPEVVVEVDPVFGDTYDDESDQEDEGTPDLSMGSDDSNEDDGEASVDGDMEDGDEDWEMAYGSDSTKSDHSENAMDLSCA